jgi:probable HAF family extracellular repeat protein
MSVSCKCAHFRTIGLRLSALLVGTRVLLLTIIVACLGGRNVEGQATFTPLGTFGARRSAGLDVSADGSVVVGTIFDTPPISYRFFRWTAEASTVGPPSAGDLAAVSADGAFVVGGFPIGMFPESLATRWNAAGGSENLGTLPGGAISAASDASADGAVVVGSSLSDFPSGRPEAFRWTEATGMVGLGGLPGAEVWSSGLGTSADGLVIVGEARDADNSFHPFRWTAATGMVKLELASNGTGGLARRVSPDGSVVVGAVFFPPLQPGSAGRIEAFRWTETDGMLNLGDLPGGDVSSNAYDVSADGSVIVGMGQTFSAPGMPTINEAFYWAQGTGMLNLRDVLVFGGATGLEGWTLTEAHGVSYDGRTVVGTAIDPSGTTQAFVATVGAIPEPSAIVLSALATLLIAALYLRWRSSTSTGR